MMFVPRWTSGFNFSRGEICGGGEEGEEGEHRKAFLVKNFA